VNLGSGLTVQSLHVGYYHSCVVLNDNSFKCFGYNNFGNLGIGSTDYQGDGPNEMGNYLKPINLGTGVEIEECFDYSPTLSPTFSLSPTLSPSFSYLPTFEPTYEPTFNPTIYSHPSCSSRFSYYYQNCVLTTSSQIKCWGLNGNGELGYGDISNRGSSSNQMGDYLSFVNLDSSQIISIWTGFQVSCAMSSSLQIKCWGANDNGRVNLLYLFKNHYFILFISWGMVIPL